MLPEKKPRREPRRRERGGNHRERAVQRWTRRQWSVHQENLPRWQSFARYGYPNSIERVDCKKSMPLGWFKSLLPKSALTAEEEAWNAYPYTKTRYTTPFVEKFSIEIETYYFGDNGHQDNVFNLSGSEKRNRSVGTLQTCCKSLICDCSLCSLQT
jgi:Phosphatidylinositol transfer protein